MPKRTKSYEASLRERLRDPSYAMEYLRAALEDDDEGGEAVFLLALRDVAKANHMSYVAEATGLNRESLYRMLSHKGNPGINSLKAVLNAVGLKLSVEVANAPIQVAATWSPEIVCGEAMYVACEIQADQGADYGPLAVSACAGLVSRANPPPISPRNSSPDWNLSFECS